MSTQPNRFREHRERLGMTQAEVSAKMGISIPTVARHEGGSRLPSPALAEQYAELYGVMSADLFVDRAFGSCTLAPNRLLEFRKAGTLEMSDMSKLLGCHVDVCGFHEAGQMPTRRQIKRYAEVYKVTTAELFVRLPAYTTSEG